MILVDNSNIFHAVAFTTDVDIYDYNTFSNLMYNQYHRILTKFKNEYGELTVCLDGKNYWRKEIFPFYKFGRSQVKDNSKIDWIRLYKVYNTFKQDLKDNFHYKVIEVDKCESDDIIAVLCLNKPKSEKYIIVSSDEDFIQLHNDSIKQYSLRFNKFVESDDPNLYLKSKILSGEKKGGDSIPNVLNPENVFVLGIRQKSLTKKIKDSFLNENMENYHDEIIRDRYIKNRTLIDFRYIPDELKSNILTEFQKLEPKQKGHFFKFAIKNKLPNVTNNISEF